MNNYEPDILKFWKDNKIFKKSLDKKSPQGDYVFYDGPPFATGTPHYGHLVAGIIKDLVPRYRTMKGCHVERKWGWDCHGLPIENIVEKELKIKNKKDLENLGVEKFNKTCHSKVLKYAEEWRKTVNRLGRWVDLDHAYKTMDLDYMESVWWVFRTLYDKGLIYEGYKPMHICPRCETTLSQQEVAEGYKDVTDLTVTVKFGLVDEPSAFLLAWTTTSWTLPGNVALAVGEDIEYVKVKIAKENYILAKDIYKSWCGNLSRTNNELGKQGKCEVVEEFKGKNLVGKRYKPLFSYFEKSDLKNKKNLYTIQTADFVSTKEGTGIVHIAPAFGEDDMNLAKEKRLPFIQHVNLDGTFNDEVKDFQGLHVKPADDPKSTDKKIIQYLDKKQLLFSQDEVTHSYPHCWRCESPLLNYATSSYFVNVTQLKPKLLKFAKEINWSPAHIKAGRFGKWLNGARDWSISRQRFWATPIPIWKCVGRRSEVGNRKSEAVNPKSDLRSPTSDSCGHIKVFGSIKELENASSAKITDLHKHTLDKIEFKCQKCGGAMRRIPDVLDCWFESGSMPYAQVHYPFENKKKFEANFPAEFIAEGSDQTRAWFYYLHVIATALFDKPAYKNVIVNGIILAEDGKKMSKRLKNYPEPDLIMDKYGADALRFYLLSSPVMAAENLNFAETGVKESYQKIIILLSNVLSFYTMYGDDAKLPPLGHGFDLSSGSNDPLDLTRGRQLLVTSDNVLDQWIIAKLNSLIKEVTRQMDSYDLIRSVRPIQDFINELSTWYVRRSRDRFKGDDKIDKGNAISTLHQVLLTLAKIMAPFTPFIAEKIYQDICHESLGMSHEKSVHLESWPKANEKFINKDLISQMDEVRQIVSLGLEQRAKAGIPVRQPLTKAIISGKSSKGLNSEPSKASNYQLSIINYQSLIKAELNVMNIEWQSSKSELAVKLDTRLTPELESLGIARDLTRHINNLRKQKGLTIKDRVNIVYETKSQKIKSAIESGKDRILADTLADGIEEGKGDKKVKIKGEVLKLKM